MADKQKMPVDGGGVQPAQGKEIEGQMASGGQSGGDSYPNDVPSAEEGGFMGEGGQTKIDYHGGNQLGEQTAEEAREARDRSS